MDPLDRLAAPAADLLGRVDDLLTDGGAPADHRIWPLLRHLRTLPGPAVGAICALRPAPLAAAGTAARTLLREYDHTGTALRGELPWRGAGADAFTAHRAALAAHLDGAGESLVGRLTATAGFADAVADWISRTRLGLARTLAAALGSVEAVTLVTGDAGRATGTGSGSGPAPGGAAAAELGARVLGTIATAYEEAEALAHRWPAAAGELAYRPAAPTGGGLALDGTTRLAL
ncbi:hypothetical protein O7627_31640 [Solwaraspora sp. WMMD1047]|uniref:hypothetical protein n=1 Tax=Solwaraspora sp. WMMD1047 TaxID=3016102 RepID=UPI002416A337|nr:hypothetical protein [Solwaraspora sp. WMMD1047]MDG4833830.1 hypothetical protein [Solwaraspora sp. WMMD1047]